MPDDHQERGDQLDGQGQAGKSRSVQRDSYLEPESGGISSRRYCFLNKFKVYWEWETETENQRLAGIRVGWVIGFTFIFIFI